MANAAMNARNSQRESLVPMLVEVERARACRPSVITAISISSEPTSV